MVYVSNKITILSWSNIIWVYRVDKWGKQFNSYNIVRCKMNYEKVVAIFCFGSDSGNSCFLAEEKRDKNGRNEKRETGNKNKKQ